MPIYHVNQRELRAVAETTFGAEGIFERKDLQRMLREQISVLDERLMVIAEEFGDWVRIPAMLSSVFGTLSSVSVGHDHRIGVEPAGLKFS